jgi:hypothetical protein
MSVDQASSAGVAGSPKGRWREDTQLSRQLKQAGLLERRHRPLIREFCQQHGLTFTEASLVGSYAEAVRHLHAVGAPRRLAVAE